MEHRHARKAAMSANDARATALALVVAPVVQELARAAAWALAASIFPIFPTVVS
jgi:hypothetical protein